MRALLLALALLACPASAHAGPREDALQIVEAWAKAFTASDVDAIANLYAPDALFIGTNGKTVLTKPEEVRAYFEGALLSNRPRTAKLDQFDVLVVSDTTVVVTGFDTVTSVRDGVPTSARGRVSFVVAKRGAAWKIVHFHRSPFPA